MSIRHVRRGLAESAVRQAQVRHRPSALPEPPPKPLWRTLARQFKSPLITRLVDEAQLRVAEATLTGAAGVEVGGRRAGIVAITAVATWGFA